MMTEPLNYKLLLDLSLPWYTEGPVFGPDGDIFYTTLSGGSIERVSLTEGKRCLWTYGNKPNGQCLTDSADHLVCESNNSSIVRFSADGKSVETVLEKYCENKSFRTPNDLVVDSQGGVYFSDSVRHNGQICYFNKDDYQKVLVADMDFPNGLALTRDEKGLLITESFKNRIVYLPLRAAGTPEGPLEVFNELPLNQKEKGFNLPDGIKVLANGFVWVAHYGMSAVQVLDQQGYNVARIPIDFPLVSNLAVKGDLFAVTGGNGEPGPGRVIVGQLAI